MSRGCLLACLLAGCLPAVVRGDDDRVETTPAFGGAGEQDVNVIDLGANFDANLFDQQGGGFVLRGGAGAAGATDAESPTLARARRQAELRLTRLDRLCGLDERQQRTLALAMESDMRRVAEQIDAVRRTYAGARVNMNDQAGQRTWHQFQQDVQRCRQRMQGIFGSQSLFAKVLTTTLDPGQLERMAEETRSQRSFRWRGMVAVVLLKLDASLGLSQRQHESLEEVLLAREPALAMEAPAEQSNSHAEQMLVFMILSEADQEELRPLVSERQWRLLSIFMNQGKAMRSWIEQQGLLER